MHIAHGRPLERIRLYDVNTPPDVSGSRILRAQYTRMYNIYVICITYVYVYRAPRGG